MKLYIVALDNGNEFIAEDYKIYYDELDYQYEFKVVSNTGGFYLMLDKDKIADIKEVDAEDTDVKAMLNSIYTNNYDKKESYFLDESYSMYDMCYCIGKKCKKKCARKKPSEGICTVSDFTLVCDDYEE